MPTIRSDEPALDIFARRLVAATRGETRVVLGFASGMKNGAQDYVPRDVHVRPTIPMRNGTQEMQSSKLRN